MLNIAQTPAFARFLGRYKKGAKSVERMRAMGLLPSDAEIKSAAEEAFPNNRRGVRAVEAFDRKSDRPRPIARKATPKQRDRELHERARDRRYASDLELRARGWADVPAKVDESGKAWRAIPAVVWRMCKDLVTCTEGHAWRYWARRWPNKCAIGAIRRAALGPRGDGTTRRAWSDERARRLAALGLALLALAECTARKGPWQWIVRGIPVAVMQELLTYPDGSRKPTRGAITGHHRGVRSRLHHGELGYLPALRATGMLAKTQQWYPGAEDWEKGKRTPFKTGFRCFQIARYWIISDPPLKAGKPELIELQAEGWRALDEHPNCVRRYERVTWVGDANSGDFPVYSRPAAPS